MTDLINDLIQALEDSADQCDRWADKSQNGGWSTHQVDENRKVSNQLRRKASRARLQLKKLNNEIESAKKDAKYWQTEAMKYLP